MCAGAQVPASAVLGGWADGGRAGPASLGSMSDRRRVRAALAMRPTTIAVSRTDARLRADVEPAEMCFKQSH